MRPVLRLFSALLVLILAFALTGCGGGGGGGGNDGPAPVAATYSVEWAARARTAGPSSALSVTFALLNAQNQSVVTDVRNRNTAPAAYNATYTTTQKVKPGSYTARFTFHSGANGGGDVVASGSQAVTVGNGGAVPSIAVAGTIATVEIAADQQITVGQTRDLTFTARTAGGQAVAVSAGSAFWAVTSGGQFATAGTNGITGTAPGTAQITVTVDGKTSAAVTVNIVDAGTDATLLVPNREVLFAAYQDGDSQWVPFETLSDTMTARIQSAGGRFGFAVAFADDFGQPEVQIFHGTLAELTSVRVAPPAPAFEEDALRGVVSNISEGENVALFGAYGTVGSLFENGAYTASLAKKNPWDLVAVNNDEVGAAKSVAVRRNLGMLPQNGVNFNVATDFSPVVTNTLTATGPHLQTATLGVELHTANGTIATLAFASESPVTYGSLPVALRNAGDRYTYLAFTADDNWTNFVNQVRTTPVNVTLNVTEPLGQVTVTSEGAGEGTRGRAAFTTNGAKLYEITFMGNSTFRTFVTPGWLGAAGAKTYTTPEFFEVPGWDAAWSLGEFTNWSVLAYNNNGTLDDLFNGTAILRDGYQWSTSERMSPQGDFRQGRNGKPQRKGLPGAPIRIPKK